MPDLEQSNFCCTVLKSILAHCDEYVGWQLRTCWNESFTIFNRHFPFQERAFLISKAVDLSICINYDILSEHIFIIYHLLSYCLKKKKKAESVSSESAPLKSAVLSESVESGREPLLEGGGAGIK